MTYLYTYFSTKLAVALHVNLKIKHTWLFFLLMLLCMAAGNANAQYGNCLPNLAHHFGFDEKDGGPYLDKIRGVEATCTNCPTPNTGIFGGSQVFDGGNDGATINDIAAFEWGPNSNFAIELWVRTSAKPSDNQIMIGRKAKENGMVWWIGMDKEGRAVFALWNNLGEGANIGYGNKKINDGNWHHILVVRNGVNRENRIYVDGFSTGVSKFNYDNGTFDKSTSPVTIGYLELNNGYRFQGEIDELMVYRNYALTEVEARARYNSGNGNYCGAEQAAPIIMSEPVTYGTVGQAYRYDVQATGNPAPTYTLAGGPQGMTINATTGEITWGPTVAGTFDVTVNATNGVGEDKQTFKINVKKSISEQAGLLHHWMLHELSGTQYQDYYTPHHAQSMGTSKPEPVSGVVSGGQRFDGEGDQLDVIGSKNFDWEPDANFTIELWMRTDISSSSNRVLIGRQGKPESEPPLHWWLGIDKNGQAIFNLLDINREGIHIGQTGPRLDDGLWHQIVAVRDGASGSTKLFVDGEQIAAGNFNHNYGFGIRSSVNIGYLDGQDPVHKGYRYQGDLDEVKLFGRPLSADEIKQNYNDVYNALMELVRFEGTFRNNTVVLDWETMNEVNCEGFTIERSLNMESFEAVGDVAGSGNSTQAIEYSFTDEEPFKQDSYYRLKINRTDGTYTYSNIILIPYRGLNTTTFKVYPNPILQQDDQEVTVAIGNLVPDEKVTFFISDLTGRRLVEQEFTVESDGKLDFAVPASVTGNFRSGMYMFTIVTKIKKISRKLMVVQ